MIDAFSQAPFAYAKKSSPGAMLGSTVLSSPDQAPSRAACAGIRPTESSQKESDSSAILDSRRRENPCVRMCDLAYCSSAKVPAARRVVASRTDRYQSLSDK